MPLEGLRFLPKDELLTPAEFETVARAAVGVGFRKFRLTGGEPTLRLDIVQIVERLARVPGVDGLALTTNGLLLPELAPALKRAGLNRINVHLDSLDPATVERQMRLGSFEKIWRGIVAAEQAGLTPIKLNSVVTAGYNESDVVELARLTLRARLARAIHRADAAGRRRMRPAGDEALRVQHRDAAENRGGARRAH